MSCLLHPQIPAAAACEYCTQPHCSNCLQQFMGRSYCPSCYQQVYALAHGGLPAGTPTGNRAGNAAASEPARRGPIRPRVPGWLSAFLFLAGFLVLEIASGRSLQIALMVAHLFAGAPLPSHGSAAAVFDASGLGGPAWAAIVGAVGWATCIVVLGYTALSARVMEKRGLGALGLRWYPRVGRDFLLGSALAAALFVSIVGAGILLGWFSVGLASSWGLSFVILPFGFVVLLPFAAIEEVTMRGFLFHATSRSWGRVGALIATSAAFAALHARNDHFGDQPWAWVGLFLAGIYLGSAYLITNRIWLPLFLHTAWNLMEGPIFGLPVSGMTLPTTLLRTQPVGPAAWTGGSFGPEGGLLLCLLLLVHVAFLWSIRPLLATDEPTTAAEDAPAAPEIRSYRAIPL